MDEGEAVDNLLYLKRIAEDLKEPLNTKNVDEKNSDTARASKKYESKKKFKLKKESHH